MILTGKTLQAFQNWYWNEWFEEKERQHYIFQNIALEHLETTDKVFFNAILIEFFDSFEYNKNISLWDYCFSNAYWNRGLKEYKQSITEAIKQANYLYNERKI